LVYAAVALGTLLVAHAQPSQPKAHRLETTPAAQGDGEVDQTAIETSLRGRLQLTGRIAQ
jgi:hypothetical protein